MRRQDKAIHELPSFARYLDKVFDFRSSMAGLSDARVHPDIAPSVVFLAAFHGFVFRLPSFQQLEAELTQPALQRWIGADRSFHDDVLRYSLCGFELQGLEQMLVQANRTLKRNKAFDSGRVQGRIVAALDGVEVLSSYSRCCECCLERHVRVRKAGISVEQVQYYHRAVACQVVSSPVKAFLALEWLQSGDSEDKAASRLLRRIPELYGSRWFDFLLLDALYAQAPIFQLDAEISWDLVVSLKQNHRELYQSAVRLFARRAADVDASEPRDGKSYQFRIWDTSGLPFSAQDPRPVRVLRSEETITQNHYRRGQLQSESTDHEWLWVTTLDAQAFPPQMIRRLRHDRWKEARKQRLERPDAALGFQARLPPRLQTPSSYCRPKRRTTIGGEPRVGGTDAHSAIGLHAIGDSHAVSFQARPPLPSLEYRSGPAVALLGFQTAPEHPCS